MEMEYRQRNNDIGVYYPTFQERVNNMLPVTSHVGGESIARASAAAVELAETNRPCTPHMPNTQEVSDTLALLEEDALRHDREMAEVHSGLNAKLVMRLLDLLE